MSATTTTRVPVSPLSLVKGDRIDAGGKRTDVEVLEVTQWRTGKISVVVNNHGRFSNVWFANADAVAVRIVPVAL